MDLKRKVEYFITEFMDWFALLFIPIVIVGGLGSIIYLIYILSKG